MSDQEFKAASNNNKPLIISLVVLACCAIAGGWVYHSIRTREQIRQYNEKAAREICESHLLNISLAWRTFADEHDWQYPFALPEKQGGTLEACQRRADGVDDNALAHYLMIASNNAPNIQPRCPSLPRADWHTNESADALYHLHTARKTDQSQGILMYCPIHQLMVTAAGSIVFMAARESDLEKDAVQEETSVETRRAAQAKVAEVQRQKDAEEQARTAARHAEQDRARSLEIELIGIKDSGRTWTFQTGKTRRAKFVELQGDTVILDFGEGYDADFNRKKDAHPVAITNLAEFDQAVARKAAEK